VQPGGPEVLSGSLSTRSIRRASRWADGICGFSFGPSIQEIGTSFEVARAAWKQEGRRSPPRLVTGFWYALGEDARDQMDRYLRRYLAFLGPEAVKALVPSVTVLSAQALRDAVHQLEDLGTDELSLVPTTSDPDDVERVADILG
jgi:alkanesulfonate monooxygenase SsuD/methylene tetrahydromethanopterin reductase-like flavin-dependent oxidoreductase (luciferase family)